MPKLWNDTIASHREAVQEAVLDAAAAVVAERGLTGVTMAEVAQRAGVGRATLYKYFPDVESILTAWHQRQVGDHLRQLTEIWTNTGRLEAVLEAYAFICHEHPPSPGPAASLHRSEHVARGREHLVDFLAGLMTDVRDDVPAKELATYCVHALGAAGAVPSKAAVRRLVAVVLSGLRGEAGR
ncbi:TetR/AcrR family transcriptional regulator [Kribbella jiaozuonensis]|uniref:TetR/AcrR family transcriptional regulator n=1 Tax=Kribbella jiaozuonensis TaxID=2575441 RepID=A0A4U3LHU0_9ACTN|nr:TetR/AcrR family transcriptional regulator [Kribbella jiaozuonensis]TKK75168.1 TetR/AcrR family transcriptional regulator [Kribbella jiaozuonensis]